ncbi:MAG: type VII secretion protein EssC [Lachnospiraceae bacterium]|nr:type VII secretion protein EssC [Lachnospiraceae bacterium]
MIINLMKARQMFSLTMPHKVKGQYWITDVDEKGLPRNLLNVEAVEGEWVIRSNKLVTILDFENNPIDSIILRPQNFFNLRIEETGERVILFTEKIDSSHQTFQKWVMKGPGVLNIGRSMDSNLHYENRFVSSDHATLSYDGYNWMILDDKSRNGTFVNGYKVTQQNLHVGDYIYIMGLRIVIGHNYLAINNPDGTLTVNSYGVVDYQPQQIDTSLGYIELPEKEYYFRSPRFYREIEHAEIEIDPPPQIQKVESVPMALMLGPSLTMAMTSVSTGILSVTNTIANGGDMTQALPTIIMSLGMLLGTVLWPILTKKYEKKQKVKNEKIRQEKYLAYLDQIRDEIKRKCKEQSDILIENLVSPEECADRIADVSTKLWERVNGQSDFLKLRLGKGDIPLDAEVKYQKQKFAIDHDNLQDAMYSLGAEPKQLHGVPISISLVENTTVGVYGEKNARFNLIKSLILQMMALHSYDELKIMLITDENDAEKWDFIRPIPHFWNDDKTTRFLVTNQEEVKDLSGYIDRNIIPRGEGTQKKKYFDFTPYYVIISTSKRISEKCDALQQLLKFQDNVGFSVIFAEAELKDLPKETKTVVYVNEEKSRIFDREDTTGKGISFEVERINEAELDLLGTAIANIELDMGSQTYALPSMITFLEMFNVGKIEHLNSLTRWKDNNPTITLQTPIGVDAYGESFSLDLHEKYHGPHGLVAGMTGSGKSEFIITYILSLAVNYHPDEVSFILIDYKGGGLTGAFEDPDRGVKLPHLAGTITNLDGAAVQRSLISIQSELRRRQAIFNEARKISNEGTMDIYKYQQLYRDKVVTEPVPHLFIISDEFAELKTQQPEFMEQLISAARIGRSLGVHLILATQKPSGVVDDQIWSNSKFRVCLKVQEKADSQDMIKCPDAAELSQTGRFYLQVGFNELFALGQSAWCGAEYVPTETVEKSIDASIQVVDNLGRVLMNVKPKKKRTGGESKLKQIVAIVKYLSDLAAEESISVRPLWLDPIPEKIYIDRLEKKYSCKSSGIVLNPVIGEYDDPFNQRQDVLTIPFSNDGNCLIYGATGNGKTTFLTSLAYSLIKNHTVEELNLYIMDFGSETLKMFEKAPQVGGVMLSSDEEMIVNFLKMIHQEIDERKDMFAPFGGDYASYCRNSGRGIPNIVVMLNNYSGFAEQYEDYQDEFALLTRDGMKYGIYFVVTAATASAVRYKTQQNFKMMMTLQLNDPTDYPVIVGKTEGLIPSKFKGRGLVALDRVYEFQTAHCAEADDMQEFIRNFCAELAKTVKGHAKRVPVLPDVVNAEYVSPYVNGLKNVPVGVSKKSLNVLTVNLKDRVVYPIIAHELEQMIPFAEEFIKVVSNIVPVAVVDAEKCVSVPEGLGCICITDNFEAFVIDLFEEMVLRNNTYKDAGMDEAVLDRFEEKLYVLVGTKKFIGSLSADGKEKLYTLIEKAEAIYKIHFVWADAINEFNSHNYETWYKRQLSGTDGMWLSDGITDQYVLKLNKVTSDLYAEVEASYGYVVARNRPTLAKLLTSGTEREVE